MDRLIQRVANRYLLGSDERMYEVTLWHWNPYDGIKKARWKVREQETVSRLSDFLEKPLVKKNLLAFSSGTGRGGSWYLSDWKGDDVIAFEEPSRNRIYVGTTHYFKIEIDRKPLKKEIYQQVLKWIHSQ